MLYTVDILDMMKEKLGSDYKAARILDVHPNRINHLRHKGGTLTDPQALKAAEFLGFPPEAIILSMAAERSLKSPAFDLLRSLAEDHTPKILAAASVLAVAILANFDNLSKIPLT
ncbi:hypothetical protein [Microbulbifer taiwanensis]|uniref:XRE family transcriptional regulator n=2 Tax=Microbulbifer taiwanensis TaxID=986746 RepID=A0ABW1YTW4_9GAMM